MMWLGIDIGGTSAKLLLIDDGFRVGARREVNVRFDGYETPIITTVVQAAQAFVKEQACPIAGIGVSATGQIDLENGVVIGTNGKIPGWEGSELARPLREAFHVPVCALNDADAAVLAEWILGNGRGCRDLLMITIGTGVGGGIITNGHLLTGRRGLAGELGHVTLYQNGRPCACGKRGCYESYAAASALRALYWRSTGLRKNSKQIFELGAQGDAATLTVLDHWTDDIAAGLSGLVHIFSPERVLIGGGVCTQEELLIEPVRRKVLSTVMRRFAEDLVITRAALGNDAGALGAVCHLRGMDRKDG